MKGAESLEALTSKPVEHASRMRRFAPFIVSENMPSVGRKVANNLPLI
jgi:hypothetical protein